MEKPSTFDRAFWILWIMLILQTILPEIYRSFYPDYDLGSRFTLKYITVVLLLFLFFTLWFWQIKKAKDWARILNLVSSLIYSAFGIYTYLVMIYEGTYPKIYGTLVFYIIYTILNAVIIYASLIVFSKKSTEYINYKYHLKQDMKREKKEGLR